MEKKDLDKGNQLSDSRFASEARPILFETVERRALCNAIAWRSRET